MTDWSHLFLDVPREEFERVVSFWESATGWASSTRRGEDGQFLTLVPPAGPDWIKVQAVGAATGGVHLDLADADREASVARSTGSGATCWGRYDDVVVMRSPGGLVHCHTLGDPTPAGPTAPLAQVCLDVPAAAWDREVEHWIAVTGRQPRAGESGAYLHLDGPGARHLVLQRTAETDGPVRVHPDLLSTDRHTDTVRHVEAGAEVLSRHDGRTVLQAPGGHRYCLTDALG